MGTIKTTNIETITGSGTLTIGQSGETISVPSGATLTVPNGGLTGQNYPAFEAYLSADQTVSSAVITKVEIDTELFDTDSCYDNSVNYRFTPNVAGKYMVYTNIMIFGNGDIEDSKVYIYKNGSLYRSTTFDPVNTASAMNQANVINTAIIDMNGTTDYIESFGVVQSGGSTEFKSADKSTYFGAYKIGS